MADTTAPEPGSRFMLDKRLNIAALVGFVVTACSFMWYAAQADSRLAAVESRTLANATSITRIDGKANSLDLVQFRLTAVESTTARIEGKLDALADKVR